MRGKRYWAPWSLFAFTLTGALSACNGAAHSPAVVDPKVTVIEGTPGVNITVTPDSLTFPLAGNQELMQKQAGDMLVNGQGAGFLRKVVSVAQVGDQIVIATQPATLTEVFESGQSHSTVRITQDGKADGPSLDGLTFDIGNTEVLTSGNVSMHLNSGSFQFTPSLDLNLDIEGHHLQNFEAILSGALNASADVTVESHGMVFLSYAHDFWESPPSTFVQFLGLVPVVEVATVTVGIAGEVDGYGQLSLNAGAEAHASLTAGVRFSDGQWSKVGDHTFQITTHGPAVKSADGTVDFLVYPYARVELKFYDLAGPYLEVDPYVQLETSSDCKAQVSVGLTAVTGGTVKMPFLKESSTGFEGTLFDISKPIGHCLVGAAASPDGGSSSPDGGL